jgi:hypothetical protein
MKVAPFNGSSAFGIIRHHNTLGGTGLGTSSPTAQQPISTPVFLNGITKFYSRKHVEVVQCN